LVAENGWTLDPLPSKWTLDPTPEEKQWTLDPLAPKQGTKIEGALEGGIAPRTPTPIETVENAPAPTRNEIHRVEQKAKAEQAAAEQAKAEEEAGIESMPGIVRPFTRLGVGLEHGWSSTLAAMRQNRADFQIATTGPTAELIEASREARKESEFYTNSQPDSWEATVGANIGNLAGSLFSSGKQAAKAGAAGAAIGAAGGAAGGPVGALAGAATGAGIGLAAGFISDSYVTNSGQIMGDLRDAGVDENTTKVAGTIGGSVMAALDMVGIGFVAKPFVKLAERRALQAEIADQIKQRIAKSPAREALKEYLVAGGVETATETAQQIVQDVSEDVAKSTSGDYATIFNDPKRRHEVVMNAVNTAVMTAEGMAAIGIPGMVVSGVRAKRQSAMETGAPLVTPEDQASPLPTDLIQEGKGTIAQDVDLKGHNDVLAAAGLPSVGKRVNVSGGALAPRTGTIGGTFNVDGEHGVSVAMDDGSTFEQLLKDYESGGISIEELVDKAMPLAQGEVTQPESNPVSESPAIPEGEPIEGFNLTRYKNRVRGNESGGNDQAKNPRSSASGRYQITDATWAKLGGDPNKRNDPAEQERLMDKLTDQNAGALEHQGIKVTDGNMYLAHFLGAAGAINAIHKPNDQVSAKVQEANPFTKGWTNGQLAAWANRKMGGKPGAWTSNPNTAADRAWAEKDKDADSEELKNPDEEPNPETNDELQLSREQEAGSSLGAKAEQADMFGGPALTAAELDAKRHAPAILEAAKLSDRKLESLNDAVDYVLRRAPNSPAAGDTSQSIKEFRDAVGDQTLSNREVHAYAAEIDRLQNPEPVHSTEAATEAQATPSQEKFTSGPVTWQKFAPETGTLGIPRAEMPQVKGEHRGAMVNFLEARGVSATEETVDPKTLKPTQAEYSPEKVASWDHGNMKPEERKLLISSDNHLVDGHHQWLKMKESGEPIAVIRLDKPVRELLPLMHEFPSSTTSEGAGGASKTVAHEEVPSLRAAATHMAESIYGKSDSQRKARDQYIAAATGTIEEPATGPGEKGRAFASAYNRGEDWTRPQGLAEPAEQVSLSDVGDEYDLPHAEGGAKPSNIPQGANLAGRQRYANIINKDPEVAKAIERRRVELAGAAHKQQGITPTKFNIVWKSKPFKDAVAGMTSRGKEDMPHRESPVAEAMVRGWIDGQANNLEALRREAAGPIMAADSISRPDNHFNPRQGYVEAFYAARTGKPTEIRTKGSEQGRFLGVKEALDELEGNKADQNADQPTEAAIGEAAAKAIRVQAEPHQAELETKGEDIAEATGADFITPGIKSADRITEKAINEHYKSVHNLKDIVRGGFVVDSPEQAEAVAAAVTKGFTVNEDKGWKVVAGGYYDHKIIVEFKDGIKGEVQIIPSPIFKAKKAENEATYNRWRTIPGALTDNPPPEAQELERQMIESYAKAASGTSFASSYKEAIERKASGNSFVNSVWVNLSPGFSESPPAGHQAPSSNTKANPLPSETPRATGRPSTSENESTGSAIESHIGASTYGAKNRLVTRDRADELRAKLRDKLLNQVASGIDPEVLAMGTELAVFHIEAGARKFADFAQAMVKDLGLSMEQAKRFLRGWYNGARDMMEDAGHPVADMDGPDEVRAALDSLKIESQNAISAEEEANASTPATGSVGANDRAGDAGRSASDVSRAEGERGTRSGGEEPGRGGEGELRPSAEPGDNPSGEVERPANGEERQAGVPQERGGTNGNRPSRRVRARPPTAPTIAQALGGLKREGSWKATAERNLDIVELVNRLEAEHRPATPEEQALLAKFTGWGASEIRNNLFPNHVIQRDANGQRVIRPSSYGEWGPLQQRAAEVLKGQDLEEALQSTQYAHYTSEAVIRSIWDALERLGFGGGTVLEPGMGIGNFYMLAPDGVHEVSHYTGIELDGMTAKIAKYLLPQESVIHGDYTKTKLPNGFFDAAWATRPSPTSRSPTIPTTRSTASACTITSSPSRSTR
jgi:hypothetical protein